MKTANGCCALIALGMLTVPAMAGIDVTFIFDDAQYLSPGDSPFDLAGPGSDFLLEDFEDGIINSPGLSISGGAVRAPSSFTDSVDADDGLIDGFGVDGRSYWTDFGSVKDTYALFEFNGKALGGLPKSVGIVWTDGNVDATTTFWAWGPEGELLGTFDVFLGGGNHQGQTGEDRFLGVFFEGGISAIEVSADMGRIELDHVQYGDIVPAPGVLALLGLSGLIRRRSRRRSA